MAETDSTGAGAPEIAPTGAHHGAAAPNPSPEADRGACGPLLASAPAARHPIHLAAASRTRTVHGAWALGPLVAAVHSSRRAGEALGVTLTVSDGAVQQSAAMLASQARAVAAALLVAADTVELRGSAQ